MSRRLLISGVVQGVGYRQWMCRQAEELGLAGWVRNRRDGSVEAVVEGPDEALAELIERAHRGPRSARVSAVEVAGSDEAGFVSFDWRPTA